MNWKLKSKEEKTNNEDINRNVKLIKENKALDLPLTIIRNKIINKFSHIEYYQKHKEYWRKRRMKETILKTEIKREAGFLYYCGTDKEGNLTLCKTLMKRRKKQ